MHQHIVEAVVVFGWVFVLVCAWGLANYRSMQAAEAKAREAETGWQRALHGLRLARDRMADLLEAWEKGQEERYVTVDRLLRSLPKTADGPPYYRMMEAGKFDMVACQLASKPVKMASYVALDFDAVEFRLNGQYMRGWQRGGWIFVPVEVIGWRQA